ncbi:MAG: DnaD domain protein [Lachnospiraceae bacterium]|nr:DnaD domain protein [Lachnospiraceae bacterium]
MGEDIKNLYDINVTMVSNTFLEDHLQDADPYFIKVYLYYLWKKKDKIDITEAADALNLTNNDVERAIKYWISKKVLAKDTVKKEEKVYIKTPNLVSFKEKRDELVAKRDDNDAFNELIFFAEKVLPNTISSPQLQALSEMYNVMKLPVEVIEYLIEYIAQNETYTSKYMLTIANSWFEQGIKTRNEAKAFTEKFGKVKKTKTKKGAKKPSSFDRNVSELGNEMEFTMENKDKFLC